MIVGHRAVGASETKLEDFQKALDLGLEMIEFDLRMSGDGQLVVFHGPPGTEGKNILRNRSVSEIEKSVGFALPRFSEVVSLCQGKIRFDIEIKESDILPHVLASLQSREDHIVTSFLDSVVLQAKEEGMRAGLILGMYGIGLGTRLSEIFPGKRKAASHADFLLPERRIYKASPLKRPFQDCIVWGVNDAEDMKRCFLDSRVQAIITDQPEKARRIKEEIL